MMDDIDISLNAVKESKSMPEDSNGVSCVDENIGQQILSNQSNQDDENFTCRISSSSISDLQDANDNQTSTDQPSCSRSSEDQEFDYQGDERETDDEETIDEEEKDDPVEDEEELNDLAKEGEMPLDDLLALYYSKPDNSAAEESKSSDNENEDKDSNNEENESCDNDEENRQLRSTASLLSPSRPDSGDEENDRDYVPPAPEDWKKAPRVGEEYQVNVIPAQEQQTPDYDDTTDQLIWCPSKIDNEKVENYLLSVGGTPSTSAAASCSVNFRDNEDALFLLTQCDHDVTEAIRRYKRKPPPLASELAVWSAEECRQFEHGLSMYGKNFHIIHHNKVKTKSVGEIVKFYYIWKKSRRYDNFSAKTRLGKKKDPLHPGVTDYMDRLLDETDVSIAQHGNTSASHLALSHSAALQQHLLDLQLARRQHQDQHPQDTYGSEAQEMNGLLDEEFIDDMDMFDNIVPTLPANHVFPPVPFSSVDPGINVGYSDPGQFAPIATTTIHPEVPISLGAANQNNNCHVTTLPGDVSSSLNNTQTFQPFEHGDIVPGFSSISPSEISRIATLPPDLLSSIDELETAYCGPSSSDASTTYSSSQSMPLDSISVDSPSEARESLNLKRFHSNPISDSHTDGAKRRKTDETQVFGDKAEGGSPCASQSLCSHDDITNKPMTDSSVTYQTASQSNMSHENMSDFPRIASC